jgi:hypothetical protein
MDRYARQLRIQYFGARYHVMSRGDRREAIFYADADRVEFLRNIRSDLPKIRGRSPTRRVELGRVIVFGNTSKSPVLYLPYQREPEMRLMNWLVSTCRLYVARFVSRSRENE